MAKAAANAVKSKINGHKHQAALADLWPAGAASLMPVMDRKLLESSVSNVEANVIVAQDGSGDYTTIQEAVNSVPDKSKSRHVIYVKSGIYKENVEVGKKKKNVMIVGDAVAGDGFILQDIWIQNTAGP
ncbi:hypothetical protein NC652_028319 [Populus alba x Populus x berolinensis]|nr:hypothetical protein NC652_028319 [Populus alba x Populus x berolinensis]